MDFGEALCYNEKCTDGMRGGMPPLAKIHKKKERVFFNLLMSSYGVKQKTTV